MVFEETSISGLFKIKADKFFDNRGSLTKMFTEKAFKEHDLPTSFVESFFSVSAKNVIRGMHLQLASTACQKLVYVAHGAIVDVVLDLRPDQKTYGSFEVIEMSNENHIAILVPEGCAHGFLSREDDTCVVYMQTKMRDAEHEAGIKYDSFGMDWGVNSAIISERDQSLPTFREYQLRSKT